MNKKFVDDKRTYPRYSVCENRFSVKLDLGSIGLLDVEIKDIGLGGIGLHLITREMISGSDYHDRSVAIRFFERLPGQEKPKEILDISGKIRWSQYDDGKDISAIGVHFGQLDPEKKAVLKVIISTCLKRV